MEQMQVNNQQTYSTPPAPGARKLERRDAKLAGVAGGLGAYFDIDPTIIRVLLIGATLVSGPVVPLLYVAAWIIMPEAGYVHPTSPAPAQPAATAPGSWAPAPAPTTDVATASADDTAVKEADASAIDEATDGGSEVTATAHQS